MIVRLHGTLVCVVCVLSLPQRLTTYLSHPSLQCLWIALLAIGACASTDYSVIAAVNVGGGPLTAASGIRYEADNEQLGTVSNAGKRHVISVAPVEDQALFETCRHMACVCASCYKRSCNILADGLTFRNCPQGEEFRIPIRVRQDGSYVLVLQWTEFRAIGESAHSMTIALNGVTVHRDLSIYGMVSPAKLWLRIAKVGTIFLAHHRTSVTPTGGAGSRIRTCC